MDTCKKETKHGGRAGGALLMQMGKRMRVARVEAAVST